MIRRLKKVGYEIHNFYFWLPSADLSLSRVLGRVMEGGHDIPGNVILRRFERSIQNFMKQYRLLGDSWTIFDNTGDEPRIVAFELAGKVAIIDHKLFEELLGRFGKK